MLKALQAKRPVYASDLIQQQGSVPKGKVRCPVCAEPVFLKKGRIKQPHFSHYVRAKCLADCLGETEEHLEGKRWLFEELRATDEVEMEAYLPVIRQRPDLLLHQKIVLEVQCSPLLARRFEERMQGYQRLGLAVYWLLGKKLWWQKPLKAMNWPFLQLLDRTHFVLWQVDCERHQLEALIFSEEGDLVQRNGLQPQAFTQPIQQLKKQLARSITQRLRQSSGRRKKTTRQRQLRELAQWRQWLFFKKKSALKVQEYFYRQGRCIALLPSHYFLRSSYLFYTQGLALIWHDCWFQVYHKWLQQKRLRSGGSLQNELKQLLKAADCPLPQNCYISVNRWLGLYVRKWLEILVEEAVIEEIAPGIWQFLAGKQASSVFSEK